KPIKQCGTNKSRKKNAHNNNKPKTPQLSCWRKINSLITRIRENNPRQLVTVKLRPNMKPTLTLLPGVRGRTSIVTQSLTVYFSLTCPPTTEFYTLSLHDALPI